MSFSASFSVATPQVSFSDIWTYAGISGQTVNVYNKITVNGVTYTGLNYGGSYEYRFGFMKIPNSNYITLYLGRINNWDETYMWFIYSPIGSNQWSKQGADSTFGGYDEIRDWIGGSTKQYFSPSSSTLDDMIKNHTTVQFI